MSNIQLIVDGVTVYQSGSVATPSPAPTPIVPAPQPPAQPPAAPPAVSSGSREVTVAISAADGVNKQLQSQYLNDRYPNIKAVAFAFDVPAEATGTRVVEFTNASYATNASCRVALSRSADDALGAQGFAFGTRTGVANSGNMEFAVNSGYSNIVLGAGRWYLVMELADIAALRASGGYQADRLFWLRDNTQR